MNKPLTITLGLLLSGFSIYGQGSVTLNVNSTNSVIVGPPSATNNQFAVGNNLVHSTIISNQLASSNWLSGLVTNGNLMLSIQYNTNGGLTNFQSGVTLSNLTTICSSNYSQTSQGWPDQGRDVSQDYLVSRAPVAPLTFTSIYPCTEAEYLLRIPSNAVASRIPFQYVEMDAGAFSSQDTNSGLLVVNASTIPDGLAYCAAVAHSNGFKFEVYVGLCSNTDSGGVGIGLGITNNGLNRNLILQTNAWQLCSWGVDAVRIQLDNTDGWTAIQQQNDVLTFTYWLHYYSMTNGHPVMIQHAEREQANSGTTLPWNGNFINIYYPPNPGYADGGDYFGMFIKFNYFAKYSGCISPGHYFYGVVGPGNYPPSEQAGLTMSAIGGYDFEGGFFDTNDQTWQNQDMINILQDPGGRAGVLIPAYSYLTNGLTNAAVTNLYSTNQCWVKQLTRYAQPTIAMALFNSAGVSEPFTFSLTNLGINRFPSVVWDCWNHDIVGYLSNNTLTVSIPATNAGLYVIQNLITTSNTASIIGSGYYLTAAGNTTFTGNNTFTGSNTFSGINSSPGGSVTSTQWGLNAYALSNNDTVFGTSDEANHGNDTGFGSVLTFNADEDTAIGFTITQGNIYEQALGINITQTGFDSTALGFGQNDNGNNHVFLVGEGTQATGANQAQFGSSANPMGLYVYTNNFFSNGPAEFNTTTYGWAYYSNGVELAYMSNGVITANGSGITNLQHSLFPLGVNGTAAVTYSSNTVTYFGPFGSANNATESSVQWVAPYNMMLTNLTVSFYDAAILTNSGTNIVVFVRTNGVNTGLTATIAGPTVSNTFYFASDTTHSVAVTNETLLSFSVEADAAVATGVLKIGLGGFCNQ